MAYVEEAAYEKEMHIALTGTSKNAKRMPVTNIWKLSVTDLTNYIPHSNKSGSEDKKMRLSNIIGWDCNWLICSYFMWQLTFNVFLVHIYFLCNVLYYKILEYMNLWIHCVYSPLNNHQICYKSMYFVYIYIYIIIVLSVYKYACRWEQNHLVGISIPLTCAAAPRIHDIEYSNFLYTSYYSSS